MCFLVSRSRVNVISWVSIYCQSPCIHTFEGCYTNRAVLLRSIGTDTPQSLMWLGDFSCRYTSYAWESSYASVGHSTPAGQRLDALGYVNHSANVLPLTGGYSERQQ